MKKLCASLLTCLTSASAFALPVGNPTDASLLLEGLVWERNCASFCDPCSSIWDAWSFRAGFYGDYVFNNHMRIDDRDSHDSIHSSKLFTNAAFLAVNFWERVDLFGTLGETQLQFEARTRVLGSPVRNSFVFFETDTHFSWSLGVRGTIWECGCLGVGAEAQYFFTRPHLNSIHGEFDNPFYFQSSDRARYREWQLGLGISYRINLGWCTTALIPYAAVKYNRAHVSFDRLTATTNTTTYRLFNFENEQHWGAALGLTLVGNSLASVTVEGRFANERAVYVNTQFRF